MQEEWRTIQNFPEYMVSNYGRVKSFKKKVEIIMCQYTHYKGYKFLYLMSATGRVKFFVHRLVAVAFIPNPERKPIVNHIDCNKSNNHLSNLEWMTDSENVNYYYQNRVPVPDGHEF